MSGAPGDTGDGGERPLEVAIVGCGHMGWLHAATVARAGARVAVAVDLFSERAERLAARFGARVDRAAPGEVDAVIVAVPVTAHAEVAAPVVRAGAWCLVEKALAHDLEAASRIAGPRVAVGHSERFNPAVRALGANGRAEVRDVRCARRGPPSGRGEDVDVVLDRMVHDLDLLAWWWGGVPEVVDVDGSPWSEVTVELASPRGRARLTAARAEGPAERRADLWSGGDPWALDLLRGEARRDGHPVEPPDRRDALGAQWSAFVDRLRGRPSELATAADGLTALRLALRIRDALRDRGGP